MLISLKKTASTSTHLQQIANKDMAEFTVVWTKNQTKGRGSFGSEWESEKNKNLTFSFLLRQIVSLSSAFTVSMWVACVLKEVLADEVSLNIKWPNDLILNHKKVGGILIENTVQGKQVLRSIIGIGLNVNQRNFDGLARASSFLLETGEKKSVEHLLHTIMDAFKVNLPLLSSEEELLLRYQNTLYKKDEVASFKVKGGIVNGVIRGVSKQGQLRVDIENSAGEIIEQKYNRKEIELLF